MHLQARQDVIRQVRCSLRHASGIARRADAPALAGEGNEVVMPTVITAGAGKAVRSDAALQILHLVRQLYVSRNFWL